MVREELLSSFESIQVFILPTPCEDARNLHLQTTSESFRTSIKEPKNIIYDQLSEPRSYGNVVVNFETVDVLVKTFVQNLEDGDIINFKSVVRQLQRGTVDEAKQCFEENLIKAYNKIDVPVKDGLEEQLIRNRDALLEKFRKGTTQVDLEEEYRNSALKNLEDFSARELDNKRKENQSAIEQERHGKGMLLEKSYCESCLNALLRVDVG